MAIDVVGSKMKPDNGYGQNGYAGPSSDLPGQRTKINSPVAGPDMLEPSEIKSFRENAGWQTRPVAAEQKVPTTKGMRSRSNTGETVPTTTMRRVTTPASNRSFQR